MIIISCAIIAYLSYEYLKSEAELAKDPIEAVPQDAAIIIESQNLQKSWLRISETNLVYGAALGIPDVENLDNILRKVDSLLATGSLSKSLFDNKSAVISFHSGNGVQYFLATSSSKETYSEIKELMSNYCTHVKTLTKEFDLEQFEVDGTSYFLGYSSPFIMFSSDASLINKSVLSRKEDKSIFQDEHLPKLRSSSSSNLGVSIFINGPRLGTLLSGYITKELAENWQQGTVLPTWMLLDVNEKSNTIIFNGLSTNDAKNIWFRNIRDQDPLNTKSLLLLPTDLLSLKRFSISDPALYFSEFSGFELEELSFQCDCDPKEVFSNWITGEVLSITFGNEKQLDHAYLVGCEGTTNIEGVMSSFGVVDTVFKQVYNADLHLVNDKRFLKLLNISDTSNAQYYFTRMNDYVVISTENGLSKIAYQYKASQASIPNNRFINFAQKLMANYSSADAYFSWESAIQALVNLVKPEYQSELVKIKENLSEINGVIWQGSLTKDNQVYHSIAINTNQANEQKGAVQKLWNFTLQHQVSSKPQLIKNHQTGTNELVVFDNSNNLILISATGKHKWTKPIGEAIIGQVKQIDLYKNGKFQLLFNTANKIHVIDINGNEVEGFPIKLPSQATNEVVCFDYENNGNYRFLINTIDRQFRNYGKDGKAVEGWMAKQTDNIVVSKAERFVLDGMDYIATNDISGKIYLYNRKGEYRESVPGMISTNEKNNIFLQVGTTSATTKYIFKDSVDRFVELSLTGERKEYFIDSSMHDFYHRLVDLENDKLPDYVLAFGNKLSVYGPDRTLRFTEIFDFDIKGNLMILGDQNKYTLLYDSKNQQVYLYNYQFKPVQDFPQEGSINSCLGDLNNDGKIEFITIDNGSEVICYTIDLLFGI